MIFIFSVAVVIYFILIAWTWHNLGGIEKSKKITFIILTTVIMYVITLVIFQMSTEGIRYPTIQMQNDIKNALVAIFTGINGIIVMPQIGKMLDQVNEGQIEKEKAKKKILILVIIFVLCIIFEKGYMKDTQEGILKIYNSH